MNEKPSRLGRGLAALIGDMATLEGARISESGSGKRLPVDFLIANRANPRREFDAEQLEELTNSVREKGVMQPLLVRPTEDPNQFEIIAGERRWRAAQRAGLNDVPVIVRDVDDKEALELAIIENVQRADLNPLEEAMGYQELIEQFGYAQGDLAKIIGKSRSHVANTLRLMKLPEPVQGMLREGQLTAGHARALLAHDHPERLASEIIEKGLNVRQVEALAQEQAEKTTGRAPKARERIEKDADTKALEKALGDSLGMVVSIDHRGAGGELRIRYKSLEQLDDICRRLRG